MMAQMKMAKSSCSNVISKNVSVSCDGEGKYVLDSPEYREFDETIYNFVAKGSEMVGQLVMEKIEHYHRIWPDFIYDSVTYHKDQTGGMRCHFKFIRK